MLNLNDVRVFVQVVTWGGFAPAARALGVPKSTLSKRVAELERALDVTLVRRTTRRFVVTPIGNEFLQQATAMVHLAEAAQEVVRGRRAEPAGPVKLTCSVPTAQDWLASLLPKIAKQHPKVELTLHTTDRMVDIVREGFDLAVRDHFDPLPDSSLVQRTIAVDDMVLVAARSYLRGRKAPRAPADLAHHDALVARVGQSEWTLGDRVAAVTVRVRPRLTADETTVLIAAARAGLGIASLPFRACREDLERGSLRRVLPKWSTGRVTTSLVFADRRATVPSVRAVADALIAGRA